MNYSHYGKMRASPTPGSTTVCADMMAALSVTNPAEAAIQLARWVGQPYMAKYRPVKFDPDTGNPVSYDWRLMEGAWDGKLPSCCPLAMWGLAAIPPGQITIIGGSAVEHVPKRIDSEGYSYPAHIKLRAVYSGGA